MAGGDSEARSQGGLKSGHKKTPRESRRDLSNISNSRPKSQMETEVADIIGLIIHPVG